MSRLLSDCEAYEIVSVYERKGAPLNLSRFLCGLCVWAGFFAFVGMLLGVRG